MLSGDATGEYIVVEQRDDGRLAIESDTSMEAILLRQNLTPATLKEFEAEHRPIQPADGEG